MTTEFPAGPQGSQSGFGSSSGGASILDTAPGGCGDAAGSQARQSGVAQFKIWKTFFDALPWWNLIPDQTHTVVTAGLGTYGNPQTRVSQSDFCTAAGTPDGSLIVAYMPTARTITINMASLKAPALAKWFDPTNGTYATIPGGPFANTGTRRFTPPGKNSHGDGDWVLLLGASHSPR